MTATLPFLDPVSPVGCCTPLSAPSMTEGEAQATATLFRALADPARVKIVNLLARSDTALCVCELTAKLGLSQPTVSHHLKKLTGAGLLRRRQRGTWAHYELDPAATARLASLTAFSGD